MKRTFGVWGASLAFLAVALGAFGAHGLRGKISADALAIFQTGVHYQLVHALALLLLAALGVETKVARAAGWLFVAGVVVFSGSLYLLAISGAKWWGAITPVGGLCFLVGWLCLIVVLARR